MAKLSDHQKLLLVADFHTNKFSQRQLAKKYDVSVGTVSKLTKEVTPKNEHLVNAQMSILSAYAVLPNEQMNAIMNTAKDEMYNKGLATNATQLNLIRMTEFIGNNKKLEKVGVGAGLQELVEVGLGSGDYKNIQEGIDKASVTLGVNERFSTSQIQVNNQNNQSNEITLEIE